MDRLEIQKLVLGPYQNNCYVIGCPGRREVLVVDAPAGARDIVAAVGGRRVEAIVLTHTHGDHVTGLKDLRREVRAPLAVHELEADNVGADRVLRQDDILEIGECRIKVLHTPGHTVGSICLLHDEQLISGDTLFPGGPGKTATPGDFQQIVQSIGEKLLALPDGTRVYPGHGAETVLGREKREFAVFRSKTHPAELCGDVVWLTS